MTDELLPLYAMPCNLNSDSGNSFPGTSVRARAGNVGRIVSKPASPGFGVWTSATGDPTTCLLTCGGTAGLGSTFRGMGVVLSCSPVAGFSGCFDCNLNNTPAASSNTMHATTTAHV